MMKLGDLYFVKKYSPIDAIFSIHYSQIKNDVEPEKHIINNCFTVRANLGV